MRTSIIILKLLKKNQSTALAQLEKYYAAIVTHKNSFNLNKNKFRIHKLKNNLLIQLRILNFQIMKSFKKSNIKNDNL